MHGAVPHFPNTPSRLGVWLSTGTALSSCVYQASGLGHEDVLKI